MDDSDDNPLRLQNSDAEFFYNQFLGIGTDVHYSALLQRLANRAQVDMMSAAFPSNNESDGELILPLSDALKKSEFFFMTKMASGLATPNRSGCNATNISQLIQNRQIGTHPYWGYSSSCRNRLNNRFLPNTMKIVDFYNHKIFCGIFSKEGNYYLTGSQDRRLRLYDSTKTNYNLLKTYQARDIGWSIIDVTFSPSEEHIVYSTWSYSVYLCNINDDSDHKPICFVKTHKKFCVFCVLFSSCGRELVGGASDGHLFIYDLVRGHRILELTAHDYDVNTAAFADENSQILYTGADDSLIKVWDRRTMNESNPKPVGVLAGHVSGVTFIDSRGDGRHLISNSKDQSIKLWDIRVFSSEKAAKLCAKTSMFIGWDYRWQQVPRKLLSQRNHIEGDTSVMTYKGHIVLKTLLRCRFSPVHTTGQRYIYTGSGIGDLIVYDALTGNIVMNENEQKSCIRDVYWHPYRNEILTSCWDGTVGQWIYTEGDEPGKPIDLPPDSRLEPKRARRNEPFIF